MSMKIDKYVNAVLMKFWPEDEKGNRKVRFHSQNLNDDERGNPKGLPWEGRWWFNFGLGKREREVMFSWCFQLRNPVTLAGGHVQADGEGSGVSLYAGLYPVRLFLNLPVPSERWRKKYGYTNANFMDVALHAEDLVLHWQFGGDTMSWSSRTPKWRHGAFHFLDLILGERQYKEGRQEIHSVKIPMPEGAYDATVKMHVDRWERPRWFPLVIPRCTIDVPIGIPFPGKGENSYDCGEDCSYGFTGPAKSVEDAIGKQVTHVLHTRRKRGAWSTQYPPPAVRAVEVEKQRREAKANAEREDNAAEASNKKPSRKGPSRKGPSA